MKQECFSSTSYASSCRLGQWHCDMIGVYVMEPKDGVSRACLFLEGGDVRILSLCIDLLIIYAT